MTKYRATVFHLTISIAVVAMIVGIATLVWYPPPLFSILGGYGLLALIAGIDIVLGPVLTFVVFKSGKKGLKFDLFVIGVCQAIALCYGLYTIAGVRPAYIVFVKDRFELVRAFDVNAENYLAATQSKFDAPPWSGPKIIGVEFPKDEKEQFSLIESTLAGGPDIHLLPKHYANFENSRSSVAKRAKPLSQLIALNPEKRSLIEKLPANLGYRNDALGFLVYRAIREDIAMIVDVRTGSPLKAIRLKPW